MLLDSMVFATMQQRVMPKAPGYGDGKLAEESPKFRFFQKSLDIDDESLFAFTVGYQPRNVPEETRELRGACVDCHESYLPRLPNVDVVNVVD